MTTALATITVGGRQIRVDPAEAEAALRRVHGLDSVSAVATLRYGPGRTCEPLARLLDGAMTQRRAAGIDPARLILTGARAERGEDVVRVRRKAHGKADWITTVTSDVAIDLTPHGLHGIERRELPAPPEPTPPLPDQRGRADDALGPDVWERLCDVIDPDLGVNIVDLGFVRGVTVDGLTAMITMTLTSAACPLTGVMTDQIRTELVDRGPLDDFRIDWVWTPAWTPADITDDGRDQLRAIGFTF
jgi:metal-sulfur cluster biosynthetic enzyme/ribosomal protein L22